MKRGNAFESFKAELGRLQSDAKVQDVKLAFYERDKPLPYWFISNDAMTASAKKLGIARKVLQGYCRLMFDIRLAGCHHRRFCRAETGDVQIGRAHV